MILEFNPIQNQRIFSTGVSIEREVSILFFNKGLYFSKLVECEFQSVKFFCFTMISREPKIVQ